jgi:hypothetical protein
MSSAFGEWSGYRLYFWQRYLWPPRKAYSRREAVEYFQRLSPDFSVEVSTDRWRSYSYSPRSLTDWGRRLVRWVGNASTTFADELEIIITLTGKTSFTASTPILG